jgi:hypothetical protein
MLGYERIGNIHQANRSMMNDNPSAMSARVRAVDSPWLWLAVFLAGAIVALSLARAKYDWRQPQIERQYQARQRSGYAVPARDEPQELSRTGQPMLSLDPLQTLLVTSLIASSVVFWLQRWRMARQVKHPME